MKSIACSFKRLMQLMKLYVDASRKVRQETNNWYQEERRGHDFRAPNATTIVREYYERLYSKNIDNIEETDKFLGRHNL